MAPSMTRRRRFDPYKNFKFRLRWEGRYVAGMVEVSGLERTTEPVEYREGEDSGTSRKLARPRKCDAITLERGVTHDAEFGNWVARVRDLEARPGPSLDDPRKDLVLDVFDEAGRKVLSYRILRCWVSEYRPLPEQDADAHVIAIETLTLEHEGLELAASGPGAPPDRCDP